MKLAALLAVLAAGVLGTSCVSIKSVDDDQVPAAWREAMSSKSLKRTDVNGQYFADGQVVRSDGKVVNWTFVDLFFPGRYLSRHQPQLDRGELRLADSGRLTFTGFLGNAVSHSSYSLRDRGRRHSSFSSPSNKTPLPMNTWTTEIIDFAAGITGMSALSLAQTFSGAMKT